MPRTYHLPDGAVIELEHLVLDMNGTITDRGRLIEGVAERLAALTQGLDVRIATADTFGAAEAISTGLGIGVETIRDGRDKERLVLTLGAERTAAIGNGRNDVPMLRAARLAIAVIGPEGAAGQALAAADVVCTSITDALDLLLDERVLRATLRA